MLGSDATNVQTGRSVVGMAAFELWNVAMEKESNHPFGNVVAELFDLFANVSQKGVA